MVVFICVLTAWRRCDVSGDDKDLKMFCIRSKRDPVQLYLWSVPLRFLKRRRHRKLHSEMKLHSRRVPEPWFYFPTWTWGSLSTWTQEPIFDQLQKLWNFWVDLRRWSLLLKFLEQKVVHRWGGWRWWWRSNRQKSQLVSDNNGASCGSAASCGPLLWSQAAPGGPPRLPSDGPGPAGRPHGAPPPSTCPPSHILSVCLFCNSNQYFLPNGHKNLTSYSSIRRIMILIAPLLKSIINIKSIPPLTARRKLANANEPQSAHSSPLRALSAGNDCVFAERRTKTAGGAAANTGRLLMNAANGLSLHVRPEKRADWKMYLLL